MASSNITLDLWPDKAMYHPGATAVIHLAIHHRGTAALSARLEMLVADLAHVIHAHQATITLPPGESSLEVPLMLPATALRGYGIDVTIMGGDGVPLAAGATAMDVLNDWTQAPRYGFLADFAPEDARDAASVVAHLSRFHINVAQFYDWMWRHYALMPPTTVFTEALGRTLSLDTVRAKALVCHDQQIATMGYAAVYGAEPEYALAHPDEVLYDDTCQPYTLEGLFMIMNIHRDHAWRQRILSEMARAVAEVPFDGLHLDQYGFPVKDAFGPAPAHRPYRLAEDFPAFIDDARVAIQQPGEEKRVIFNAVRNWPIDTVATTSQDALYIEVWPPYETYADVQAIIVHAQMLAPQKQVIIAAYMKPLKEATTETRAQALAATRLATATIWANGGFHLLIGEANAALQDAYYPDYVRLTEPETVVLRRYWDFVVRYEAVLADRRFRLISEADAVVSRSLPISTEAQAGVIWAIPRVMPGYMTVSLINLMGSPQACWNALTPTPAPIFDLPLRVRLADDVRLTAAFVAGPDGDPRPQPLAWATVDDADGHWAEVTVPSLEYWQLVVFEYH